MSKAKTLAIELTYDCQLRCPWCIEKKHVGTQQGPISKLDFENLMHHIVKNHYTSYVYQGGEPLMYPEHLLEITDIIQNAIPEATFKTYTNGLAITEQLTDELNKRHIMLTLSIDAEGYKGLSNLIHNASEPTKIITNINNLNSKNIRIVIQRNTQFADRALLLHTIFPNTEIEIVPDYTTLTQFTVQDMNLICQEFRSLKMKSAGDDLVWFTALQGQNHKCTTETDWYILADNKIVTRCLLSEKIESGCVKFATQMKPQVYEMYQQIHKEMNSCL